MMESILDQRSREGVADAILLSDCNSEDDFIDNLKTRFQQDIIYTWIGDVLVSLNPYANLAGRYSDSKAEVYRRSHFHDAAPHVFAVAERAYRSMIGETADQCILISGESGAGKTESSKHVLRFVASSFGDGAASGCRVRDRLLESTPLLEAFGNAKTNRNDNSSRFGKYMDVQCNFKGEPVGGHVTSYLLEKSRVVHQESGEGNFHIFYHLLNGADQKLLDKLHLTSNPRDYFYLQDNNSQNASPSTGLSSVIEALQVLGFAPWERDAMWRLVAAVLHIGNVVFQQSFDDVAVIQNKEQVTLISELLECEESSLMNALTSRTIETKHEAVRSPLQADQAAYVRDALSKCLYGRLFDWLVARLNSSLQNEAAHRVSTSLIGILDIYGFEVFEKNGFEQFCINYCNEKLQQLFIELTLRSEQEEYRREGIRWEQINYFDNKIICNLVEEKHKGIISLLNEECVRPGDATDATFLEKMDTHLFKHDHYRSYRTVNNRMKKTLNHDQFCLRHYAGDVTYSVRGFIDKNNDLLYRDLKTALAKSKHSIISQVFPVDELLGKKRPETATTQFKTSLAQLMKILMSKQPSYIRCIKPNEFKIASKFDTELVRHQVKYLGLMENVRVRRAGFAYRRSYDIFLQRYKSLCPKTWPHYIGSDKDGVQAVVDHLGYKEDEYRMGRSKLFIRMPQTLFRTEDAFQRRKEELASKIQAIWKGRQQRLRYISMIKAVTVLATHWRRIMAYRLKEKRKNAALVIRTFVEGYMTRNGPLTDTNALFQATVKHLWLLRLSQRLPTTVRHHRWMDAPKSCEVASELLKDMHRSYLAGKYVKSITPLKKIMFEEKIRAELLFRGKKASYGFSIPEWFKDSRLNAEEHNLAEHYFQSSPKETIKYCCHCVKFDRHGYRERPRILVLTSTGLYLFAATAQKIKRKENYALRQIQRLVVSPNVDNFMLIQVEVEDEKKEKGDWILSVDNVVEATTKILTQMDNLEALCIIDSDTAIHTMRNGKQATILLDRGPVSSIIKNKEGKLVVVGCP